MESEKKEKKSAKEILFKWRMVIFAASAALLISAGVILVTGLN